MVCDKCQAKLGKVITPDPWKSGARNTTEGGGRKLNENKALASKARFNPYKAKFESCRICKQKVHQAGSYYCQPCAYKKGICSMCGKQIIDTKSYKQSSTWSQSQFRCNYVFRICKINLTLWFYLIEVDIYLFSSLTLCRCLEDWWTGLIMWYT